MHLQRLTSVAVPIRAFATVVSLLLVALVWGGCRRPDPVYDRVPRPIGTRDLVRAERRDPVPLTSAEWQAVRELHDRYLQSFAAFREAELIPFAADFSSTDAEAIRADERKLRSVIARHLGIMGRIGSMDDAFIAELGDALGEGRSALVERLKARRAIDRASALSVGDGGRGLLDLRQLLDAFDIDETERAMIEPTLREFDAEASSLARSIADEQATLPLSHLEVLERRGPASSSVDPALRDEARKKAMERAEWDRYAESRRDLEVLLERYAELADRAIEGVAVVLDEEEGALLRRRLLQSRLDEETARLGDPSAFQALVAARTIRVPREIRDQIEAMRIKFLAEDEERLRSLLEVRRQRHVPGVFDPIGGSGGADAVKRHKEREAALMKTRNDAARSFRDAVLGLVPDDVRGEIEALREKDRESFSNALAELVGSGRVSTLVQRRPRGFGDRDPPQPAWINEREQESRDPGELRMMLAEAPDQRAIARLLARSGIGGTSTEVVEQIVAAWRPRWDAERDAAAVKVKSLMVPIMTSMNEVSAQHFDSAAQRLIGGFDELRDARTHLEEELLAGVEAALPEGLNPAALDLWRWERAEARSRLRWRDLPFDELMRFPQEAAIPFIETIGRVPVPAEAAAARARILAAAIAPKAEELEQATESLRDVVLLAVRKAMGLAMEARVRGMRERDALSESRPEIKRIMSPVRSAAERLVELRLQVLADVVAVLPQEDGRAIREAFVRAAYPRLLEERRLPERALQRLRDEPLLSDAQRATLAGIIEDRGRARDAALDQLLSWARAWRSEQRTDGNDLNERDSASRNHPQLAGVFFDREEADARAMQAAFLLLDDDARLRHRELVEYFNDPPASGRWLD
ncbi:MAG: hypothetical protein JNL80_01115 [Phycisphaerae bacterium]|nr:hypothetical protein [Phycisphaerae bacterium]